MSEKVFPNRSAFEKWAADNGLKAELPDSTRPAEPIVTFSDPLIASGEAFGVNRSELIALDPLKFLKKKLSEVKALIRDLIQRGISVTATDPNPEKQIIEMKVVDDLGRRHLEGQQTWVAPGAALTLFVDFPRDHGEFSNAVTRDPPATRPPSAPVTVMLAGPDHRGQIRADQDNEVRVLLIAANPLDTDPLQLEKEIERIQSHIKANSRRVQIKITPRLAAQKKDLTSGLMQCRPHVLHFSGHCSQDGTLLFQGKDGKARELRPAALAGFLKAATTAEDPLEAVVLNACWSKVLAEPLAEIVGLAIGMNAEIGDESAIEFAAYFYEALAHGYKYGDAYNLARAGLDVEDMAGASVPQIIRRAQNPTDLESAVHTPTPLRSGTAAPPPTRGEPKAYSELSWQDVIPVPPPLEDGTSWHVFLSYRSIDRRWTVSLRDALEAHGFRTFFDQTALPAGSPLQMKLQAALAASQAGILVWSSRTSDSKWVAREYCLMESYSDEDKLHFVPITIDGTKPDGFPGTRLYLDFRDHSEGPTGGNFLRLLYGIVGRSLSNEAQAYVQRLDEETQRAHERIAGLVELSDAKGLVALAECTDEAWSISPSLRCLVAESLIELGEDEPALEVLAPLLESYPNALRPIQMTSLALKRRNNPGDLERSIRMLVERYRAGARDPETLGILASGWWMLHEQRNDGTSIFLERSRDLYLEAFTANPSDSFTGINAAAKNVFLGEVDAGQKLAREVQELVGTEVPIGHTDYWTAATIPEALLILRDFNGAGAQYKKALAVAPAKQGNRMRTEKQAVDLLKSLGASPDECAVVLAPFGTPPSNEASREEKA